jgi:hypothetical protein
MAYARFDGETTSWTCQVCTQSVDTLRQWYYEGLLSTSVDDLVGDGEELVTVLPAVLRQGSAKRPYRVVMVLNTPALYARLHGITGSVWEKSTNAQSYWSYPSGSSAALVELVAKGVLEDPDNILNPGDVTVVFDNRTGRFGVTVDERAHGAFERLFPDLDKATEWGVLALGAFERSFPARDVVARWRDRGFNVAFANEFTEETYRGELARARPAPQIEGFKTELWPYQAESVAVSLERTGFGIFHEMGIGKGLAHGTTVMCPSGAVRIEDISVGDRVIGSSGRATRVHGVYPRGTLPVYKVEFNDRTSVTVDGDHLWAVQSVQNGHRHPDSWLVKSTSELMENLVDGAGNCKWKIPLVKPVHFKKGKPLALDPYLLGLLLGDGDMKGRTAYTSCDDELVGHVRRLLPPGAVLTHLTRCEYGIKGDGTVHGNPLTTALRQLGLFGANSYTKFIPESYLYASPADRLALLRGLMDTDGNAGHKGANEYVSASGALADGVVLLTQSLGGTARRSVKTVNGRAYHRVYVKLMECPFLLARKAQAWVPPTKYPPNRNIKSITACGAAEVTCIAVDAPDELFVTEGFVVTHNTVVALAAGHELLHNRGSVPRVVVVVPGSIRSQWREEIERFSEGAIVVIDGNLKRRKALYEEAANAQWLIVSYSVLARDRKLLAPLVAGSLLIVDEAHRLKNPTAQRTKAVRALGERAARRLALTGTPILNDPGEWYSIISGFVAPGCFGSPTDFLTRYTYPNRWGGFEGARELKELRERSATYYTRYTKAEVATHLPPLRIQHWGLDVDPAYKAALTRAHREARLEIRDAALDKAVRSGRLGILDGELRAELQTGAEMTAVGMLRLLCLSPRLVAASDSAAAEALITAGLVPDEDGPKVEKLLDIARETQANGERVVVFSSSKRMIYLLADRLEQAKVRYVTFTGDTNQEDRETARLAFIAAPTEENPGPTVFLATDAGGEGLNLGAQCSLLVNMDIPWTPGVLAQRSSRIHRMDGTSAHYLVINLTLNGTVETGIMRMVESKVDIADAVLGEGGGRGRTTGRAGRSIFEVALEEWGDG